MSIVLALLLLPFGILPQTPVCPADAPKPVSVSSGFEVCAVPVPSPLDGEGETGILVTVLAGEHILARSGMRVGDVIVKVAGTRIRQVSDVAARLDATQTTREILIVYRRNNMPLIARLGR